MQKSVHIIGLLLIGFLAPPFIGQSSSDNSLCAVQQKVTEGKHLSVQIAGVLRNGLDQGTLTDAGCSEITWVELGLESKKNKNKLATILDHSQHYDAFVVFAGDLYGPPVPDPKLPEPIRSSYHPWWGHLNCCRTKIVVRAILEVAAVPAQPHTD